MTTHRCEPMEKEAPHDLLIEKLDQPILLLKGWHLVTDGMVAAAKINYCPFCGIELEDTA